MIKLHSYERLIVNQLLDRGVFTSTPDPQFSKEQIQAIRAIKRPIVQQRINTYLQDLIGVIPENYQENLLLLINKNELSPEEVHVLLATLKSIINLPRSNEDIYDRSVSVRIITRQVHSEVTELTEKQIQQIINSLFVERFGLFRPDLPEESEKKDISTINEYWAISPDFNFVAECLVDDLINQEQETILNDLQRVNQALFFNQFIDSKSSPNLWKILISNKDLISKQWSQLDHYDLECGDEYALLLNRRRRISRSKAFITALLVAKSLGEGLLKEDLNDQIQTIASTNFPNNSINGSQVKKILKEESLISEKNGFIIATPLIKRFNVKITD